MRAIVFINGIVHDYHSLAQLVRPDDYLVGADGGTAHCVAIGRRPHVVVGDLDSIDPALLERLATEGVAVERHPPAKDQTDLELAIERALRDGADEVILAGATGGRLDQTLANLLILAQRDWPRPVVLVEDGQTARAGQAYTAQPAGRYGQRHPVQPASHRHHLFGAGLPPERRHADLRQYTRREQYGCRPTRARRGRIRAASHRHRTHCRQFLIHRAEPWIYR